MTFIDAAYIEKMDENETFARAGLYLGEWAPPSGLTGIQAGLSTLDHWSEYLWWLMHPILGGGPRRVLMCGTAHNEALSDDDVAELLCVAGDVTYNGSLSAIQNAKAAFTAIVASA